LNLSTAKNEHIVLIRHGEPDLDKKGWRTRDEVIQFMKAYDSVGVVPFDVSPLCWESLNADTVYHSTLPRAAHTASLAFDGPVLVGSDNFREFERKAIKGCNLRLPLKWRTTSARLTWFLGWNDNGIESFQDARQRARNNARFLDEKTRSNPHVILVAHGLHNRYVLKYLKKMGWKKVFDNGNGYLSVKVLVR
jgi:broad specificity phosphatase PhoE